MFSFSKWKKKGNYVTKSGQLYDQIIPKTNLYFLDWKNKTNKNPTMKNLTVYKRQWNLCISLRRKNIKSFLSNVTKRGVTTNKSFWVFIKSFLRKKGFLENQDITLIEGNKIISSKRKLAKTFSKHYNNVGKREILKSYENHPSVMKIKNIYSSPSHVTKNFTFIL